MKSNIFQKIQRKAATFLVIALSLSLSLPSTNAAEGNGGGGANQPPGNPTLSNPTMNPSGSYNPNSNGSITFSYTLSNLSGNANVSYGIYDQNDDQKVTFSSTMQGNGNYSISWDGKLDGNQKPIDGTTYTFKVNAISNMTALGPKTINFLIDEQPPILSAPTADTPTYDPITDQDGVKFTSTLSNMYGNSTAHLTSRLFAAGDMINPVVTFTPTTQGNGTVNVVWDGKINGAKATNGQYTFQIDGYYGSNDPSIAFKINPKQTPVTVKDSVIIILPGFIDQPTISKNPFNPSNNNTVDFSYGLHGPAINNNATIYTGVYAKDNDNDPNNDQAIYTWPTAANQGSQNAKVLTWNGKNANNSTVAAGNYYFKVWGNYGNNSTLSARQVDFQVVVSPINAPAITNLKATPSTFSPNNDGSNDTTTISFDLNQDAEVTVLLGSGGQMGLQMELYKANKTAGNNLVYVWNGKVPGNNDTMANATYPIIVKASNSNGSDQENVNVTINTNPVTGNNNCGGFSDVPADLCPAFDFAKKKGIFLGDDNSTNVRPNDIINRVEAAAVMLRGFKLSMLSASGGNEGFNDVSTSQSYMTSGTVRSAKAAGIIKGYPDGTLRPAQQVIRAELIVMFARASGKSLPGVSTAPYLDTPIDASTDWYIKAVNGAKMWGWINAGSYFYPTQGMTRGDVAKLFYQASQNGLSF